MSKWTICGVPMTPKQIKAVEAAKSKGRSTIAVESTDAQSSAWRQAAEEEQDELKKLKQSRPKFAVAIRHRRKSLNLSLDALAETSGIPKASLSRIENGINTNPTVETLERVGKSLGLSLLVEFVEV